MADNEQNNPGFISKALKIASFPIAAISGLWATKVIARSNTYDNALSKGMLKIKAEDDRLKKLPIDVQQLTKDSEGYVSLVGEGGVRALGMKPIVSEALKNAAEKKVVDVTVKSAPYHAQIDELVTEHMKDLGLGGLRKQWKFLRRDQQHNALISGLTVAGIAIGAILSIANMKAVQSAFQDKSSDNERSV